MHANVIINGALYSTSTFILSIWFTSVLFWPVFVLTLLTISCQLQVTIQTIIFFSTKTATYAVKLNIRYSGQMTSVHSKCINYKLLRNCTVTDVFKVFIYLYRMGKSTNPSGLFGPPRFTSSIITTKICMVSHHWHPLFIWFTCTCHMSWYFYQVPDPFSILIVLKHCTSI